MHEDCAISSFKFRGDFAKKFSKPTPSCERLAPQFGERVFLSVSRQHVKLNRSEKNVIYSYNYRSVVKYMHCAT